MIDAAAVRRVWDEVLTLVGRKSKKVAAWAREATVRDVERDTLVLVFKHSFHASALAADPELLVGSVHEVLGGDWQVRCEVAGQASAAPAAAAAPQAPVASRTPAPRATQNPPPVAPQSQAAQPAPAADDGGDWPATARPGGATDEPATAEVPGKTENANGRAAPASRSRSTATRQTPARQAPARQAPARRQATDRQPGRSAAGRSNDRPASPGQWDGSDEPPYDPDYDPPVRDPRGYEGFDPGDEPTDEVVDEQAARQTSEQQALALLQQTLGAEKIGEVDAR